MTTLNALLLVLFALLVLGIMLHSSLRREGLVQYPFLAAAVMAGWVFPQLVGLTFAENIPREAVTKTIIFCSLCLLAGWIGYETNRRPARMFSWRLSERRLLIGATLLSMAGFYFWQRVLTLAPTAEFAEGAGWTGIITIYFFLSGMLQIGMALAVVAHLTRPTVLSTSLILLGMTMISYWAIVNARREPLVDLALLLLFFLWWRFRWVPPRVFIIGGVVAGALIVNSIGDIRSALRSASSEADSQTWSHYLDFSRYLENLQSVVDDPMRRLELTNAAMEIEAADRRLEFDYGAYFWNRIVHSYVPGQWVGSDIKQGLMVSRPPIAFQEFGHRGNPGATNTGMADAFRAFWYFGFGIFFLIGLIMSRWFRAAENGNPIARIIIMLLTIKSLLAITHTTPHFFLQFVTIAAFLVPVLFLSRTDVVFSSHRARRPA